MTPTAEHTLRGGGGSNQINHMAHMPNKTNNTQSTQVEQEASWGKQTWRSPVASANPVPKPKHVVRVDPKRGGALHVGTASNHMLADDVGLRRATLFQLLDQHRSHCPRIKHRLRGGEGLGDDNNLGNAPGTLQTNNAAPCQRDLPCPVLLSRAACGVSYQRRFRVEVLQCTAHVNGVDVGQEPKATIAGGLIGRGI